MSLYTESQCRNMDGWRWSPTLQNCLPDGAVDLSVGAGAGGSQGKKDEKQNDTKWWEKGLEILPDLVNATGNVIGATKGNQPPKPGNSNPWQYTPNQSNVTPGATASKGFIEKETVLLIAVVVIVLGFFAVRSKKKA
ncbi:MAG: hypothetical protein AAGJ18_20010 [Bacteroidota bacterium]